MTEIVNGPTGNPAVVNFGEHNGHYGHHQSHYANCGISDKDQQFAVSIEHNHHIRELLSSLCHNKDEMNHGFKEAAKEFCEVKREIADVKATILAVEATRIKDELFQAKAELLAARTAGIVPTARTRE